MCEVCVQVLAKSVEGLGGLSIRNHGDKSAFRGAGHYPLHERSCAALELVVLRRTDETCARAERTGPSRSMCALVLGLGLGRREQGRAGACAR